VSARRHGLAELGIGKLFDLIPDGLVIADAQTGRIEHWNPGAQAVFGHTSADAVGMTIETLVPEELREAHRAGLARFARGEPGPLVDQQLAVELPALTADGQRIWVELRLSALPVLSSGERLVLAIVRDVSDRHALQDELRAAAAEQESRNEQLRHFVSLAAHDLRAPLALVTGFLDAAADATGVSESTAELIGRARAQAHLVAQLSGDILDTLRLEAGVERLSPQPVDIAVLLPLTIGGEGIRLHSEPGHPAMVDERHLQRMLHNLVSNAQKYGRAPIDITVRPVGQEVEVVVRDHGDGVPAEFVDTIFDPFVRASGDRNIPGSGLGLAAVRGLAELNGGTVVYEPADPGARFVLRLPAA
jgi:PAS domain S-box-containing protein